MSRETSFCSVFVISVLTFSSLVLAGNLEPSSPPAPTMKTLDQIEPRTPISSLPYVISSSGSYYITGNLTCPANTHAITINADDVSIDFKGHTITGQGAGTSIYNGIYASAKKNIEISNGAIKEFYQGIWMNSTSNAVRIIGIRSSSNTSNGILISGSETFIKDCIVFNNSSSGISGGSNATVLNCIAYSNGGSGIYAGKDSNLSGNRTSSNNLSGIHTVNNCKIKDCTSTGNAQYGIRTGNYCRITDNLSNDNDFYGIRSGASCTVTDNTVTNNQQWGIYALNACKVKDNHVTTNNAVNSSSYGGIRATNGCLIKENMCYSNKIVNVYTVGSGNLIEANFVTNSTASSTKDSAYAIKMDYNGNYCVGNRVYNFTSPYDGISFNNNLTITTGGNYEFIYAP